MGHLGVRLLVPEADMRAKEKTRRDGPSGFAVIWRSDQFVQVLLAPTVQAVKLCR
jgi:hypothetical protein